MIQAKLVVVGGDAKTSEVNLRLPTVIGRGREVNLTLPHALVSRRHCEIYEKQGRLIVKDLGSTNGTFVNNKRIEGEEILDPEQLLTLGTVTFRAVYEVSDLNEALVEKTERIGETVSGSQPNTIGSTKPLDSKLPGPADSDVLVSTSSKETVYDQSKNQSDTDRDLEIVAKELNLESQADIAINVNEKPASLQQEITVGNLDRLPQPTAAANAIGRNNVGNHPEPSVQADPEDSNLESFLRKLPR